MKRKHYSSIAIGSILTSGLIFVFTHSQGNEKRFQLALDALTPGILFAASLGYFKWPILFLVNTAFYSGVVFAIGELISWLISRRNSN